uniref:Large ribosomal subunit protein uL4c n=1 Tax=Lophocladia kuetzingii TaxID=675577 RepID=A0A1Z1MNR5_9FLOR|nr:ribosomal protein L4 [Lophocladia kuetzingii]ARW67698.1 ribosomal protein L4 [Lophocladia kuetzingii]
MTILQNLTYQIIDNKKISNDIININLKISKTQEQQMYLIHKALKQQLKNTRIRNANTKTRGEVRGGGKKPWKQKGTGRARAGSKRSPLWKGGGVIFGPRVKMYNSKINKQEKTLALSTLLYNKFKNTIVTNKLLNHITSPSTKNALLRLEELGINIREKKQILLIVKEKTELINLSFRNIANIKLIEAQNINIISLLKADTILITVDALKTTNILKVQ